MLLTKPLTSFLHANLTPELQTLFLCTFSGKLLASSSTLPASVLRSQATLASTLYTLYRPLLTSGTLSSILPTSEELGDGEPLKQEDVKSILIQLEGGTMVIHTLISELLFCAVGPVSSPAVPSGPNSGFPSSSQSLYHASHQSHSHTVDLHHTPVGSPQRGMSSLLNGTEDRTPSRQRSDRQGIGLERESNGRSVGSSRASIAESTSTISPEGKSLGKFRRRISELAAVLDRELGEFGLGDGL